MAQVKITETVLRDSHQSLVATRMTTEEMLPILAQMDKVGKYRKHLLGRHSCCNERLVRISQYSFGDLYLCHLYKT